MAEEETRNEDGEPIEIDDADEDVEETMRRAVAAVEEVERGEESSLERDVDRLEREIADLRDRSMRTLADFDNYRKRADRERTEVRRYALMEPLRDLLEVVDNLERAVAAGGSADDLKLGIDMTLRQLGDVLRRHGVSAIEAAGKPFDPAVHEAVSRQEAEGVDEPTVADELQKGYLLHERLVRPARVVVAVPAAGGDPDRLDGE